MILPNDYANEIIQNQIKANFEQRDKQADTFLTPIKQNNYMKSPSKKDLERMKSKSICQILRC